MGRREDELEQTMTSETDPLGDPIRELVAVLDEVDVLLKNGDVMAALTARGINASLALLVAHGLRAYVTGKKLDAVDDLTPAAAEIRARLAASIEAGAKTPPGRSGES